MVRSLDKKELECKSCFSILSSSRFGIIKSRGNEYYSSYCRSCASERATKSARKIKEHGLTGQKIGNLRRTYGLSASEYVTMLQEQANCCAVCLTEFDDVVVICVDHCHNTNVVRGLLCHTCNRALGLLKDSPDILRRAVEYLEKE